MVFYVVSNILLGVLLVSLASLVNVILHEPGHAIPMLVMTDGKVSIYVGSYGDSNNSLKLSVRRLNIYIKYNPLLWVRGVCKPPQEQLSINRRILYTAAGPLISLALTIICFTALYLYANPGPLRFALALLSCFGFIYSMSSIIPGNTSKYTQDGRQLNNDAMQIVRLFKHKRLADDYREVFEFIHNKQYSEASDLFDSFIEDQYHDLNLLRTAVSTYLCAKRFSKAERLMGVISGKYTLNADDYCNLGYLKEHLHLHVEAMDCYQKSLQLNPKHIYSLNNAGFNLSFAKNNHSEAIFYLNQALAIAPDFANALSSRGYAKIKLGQMEEGLKDVRHSLRIDERNSYGYLALGVYYLEKNDFRRALSSFDHAKQLDNHTYSVYDYIELAKQGIHLA